VKLLKHRAHANSIIGHQNHFSPEIIRLADLFSEVNGFHLSFAGINVDRLLPAKLKRLFLMLSHSPIFKLLLG
jgi:hypothetical protein